MLKIELRDLSQGEYQDNCDQCGRYEDECGDVLYDLYIGQYGYEPFIMCPMCLDEMKRLLHRVEAMQEPNDKTA